MREVDLFEQRVKLKLVRGLPEDVAHRAQGRKDEDGDEEAYWYPFELCRKLIGERQITIMRKGECLVPKTLLPFVWFAVYEDYLEEDLEYFLCVGQIVKLHNIKLCGDLNCEV